MTGIVLFSHCGGFLGKYFQEQIGQLPARYGQLKGSGLYMSINNKYKYKYHCSRAYETAMGATVAFLTDRKISQTQNLYYISKLSTSSGKARGGAGREIPPLTR